ncbi:Membrane protein [Clostridium neonatale]|uniref:CPCC family cysteine-rich protein n=1 Tax=Clostridium neonatale TaxID=137838 RepID=UPI00291BB0F1|nr:CPCC family cysteine-rich protein [Clostridium neonatale]CAI3676883.1 Membrane protein [Clostridium neonatale]
MREYFTCPCCGYITLESEHEYDICPICFWEDDWIQFEEVDLQDGANKVSLRQAQKNYIEFGACEKEMLCHVRKPTVYDIKDENWNVLYKGDEL